MTTQQAKTNSNLTGAGGPIGVANGVAVRGAWWGIAREKMLEMVPVLLVGLLFAGWRGIISYSIPLGNVLLI